MFNSTLWLTLATLAGLGLGFAREWLLVSQWGAGARSDAFLVALFLPEALRMTLAGGLLSACALPLYTQRQGPAQQRWLNGLTPWLGLCAALLVAALALGAPLWVALIGPGLDQAALHEASSSLRLLALCVPGLLLHGWLSMLLQARERFVLAGLGSLLFNLPPVLWLALRGTQGSNNEFALACVLGSLLMAVPLLPASLRLGWRPWQWQGEPGSGRQLLRQLAPLLASNLASQGLALLERLAASFLGEGAITWVNLARKLINLPLIALMALNQVLLGVLSNRSADQRLPMLRRALAAASVLTLPAAVGLIGASPVLVSLLLPKVAEPKVLSTLLAWFAAPLLFGAWNALLARYSYAAGDTRLPLRCELTGSALNALLLLSLPPLFGLPGIALAAWGGVLLTSLLLLARQQLLRQINWPAQWLAALIVLAASAYWLHPLPADIKQLAWACGAGLLCLGALVFWLKPLATEQSA